MMDRLRVNFEKYCEDHEAGVKQQIEMFKEEQGLIEWRQQEMPTDYHNIKEYLRSVNSILDRKQ